MVPLLSGGYCGVVLVATLVLCSAALRNETHDVIKNQKGVSVVSFLGNFLFYYRYSRFSSCLSACLSLTVHCGA